MQTISYSYDYLYATRDIPVREMPKPLFCFLRAHARRVQREYPGLCGYCDPESGQEKVILVKHLFRSALPTQVIPQSERLQAKTYALIITDPCADWEI